MNSLKLSNGLVVTNVNDETKSMLITRDAFNKKYCTEKGWDINDLSIEQIMEIREQDEWKNASL